MATVTSSNLTKLKKKLIPPTDGQDTLRLRTATITSIASDGRATIVLNGVTVTNVPVLDTLGATLVANDVVQVLSYRGSLLVLGDIYPGPPAPVNLAEAVGSVSITPVANTPTSQTVTYPTLSGSGTICGFATANTTVPGSTLLECSVSSLTTTSTVVTLYRTNTTSTFIFYLIRRAT